MHTLYHLAGLFADEIPNAAAGNQRIAAAAQSQRLRGPERAGEPEPKSAEATWQRNYDKLKGTPLWIAYRSTNGSAVEYKFDDVVA
jgi:hypothetical protein